MQVLMPKFGKREGGLVPVVVQSKLDGMVLMLAYANEEAWRKTLETGIATFWSTSRQELWVKGATSDNIQRVNDVLIDCDGDALVYLVTPEGHQKACHTNAVTCFYRSLLGKGADFPAPDAGPKEELGSTEAEVHPDLR